MNRHLQCLIALSTDTLSLFSYNILATSKQIFPLCISWFSNTTDTCRCEKSWQQLKQARNCFNSRPNCFKILSNCKLTKTEWIPTNYKNEHPQLNGNWLTLQLPKSVSTKWWISLFTGRFNDFTWISFSSADPFSASTVNRSSVNKRSSTQSFSDSQSLLVTYTTINQSSDLQSIQYSASAFI